MTQAARPQKARRALAMLAIVALLLGGALTVAGEIPNWRPGGAVPIAMASVETQATTIACPPPKATILLIGDSHAAGAHIDGAAARADEAFGAVMVEMLDEGRRLELRARGGLTADQAEGLWRDDALHPALVIIALGTNDAAPRGWLRPKHRTPLSRYRAALKNEARYWQAEGAQVILLAPPPPASRAMARRIEPYRRALALSATKLGIAALDPSDAFAHCESAQPLLAYDGLHMTRAGHRCLGRYLANRLCPHH